MSVNLRTLEREYAAACRAVDEDRLRVDDLRRVASFSELLVDLEHLPTVFMLDADRDGLFSYADLVAFFETYARLADEHQGPQLEKAMRLQAVTLLARVLDESEESVRQWMIALISVGRGRAAKPHDGITYLRRENVFILHRLLNVMSSQHIDSQTFFDVMQNAGEEAGLMKLHDRFLDECVPLATVQQFVGNMLSQYHRTIAHLRGNVDAPGKQQAGKTAKAKASAPGASARGAAAPRGTAPRTGQ